LIQDKGRIVRLFSDAMEERLNDNEIMLLLLAGAALFFVIWRLMHRRKPDITDFFQPVSVLTEREREFYIRLRETAEAHGMQIFTKVRLADLVVPLPKAENPYWMECFNKVKAKHIDFALADGEGNVVLLVELDDTTHARPDRIERDEFVDTVLYKCGYTLIRTYGELDAVVSALEN